jgi:hypothetical protein
MLVILLFLAFAIEPAANLLARRGHHGPDRRVLALPAAASVQALVSSYLRHYQVVTSPLTGPSG